MRGKLFGGQYVVRLQRITPADAGKTKARAWTPLREGDHPRGCGENLETLRILHDNGRITPADAGKTALMPDGGAVKWDHPRGCGENYRLPRREYRPVGSPPRMRGKQHLTLSEECCIRITPADAGKTEVFIADCTSRKDHPRGCGENTKKIL